ncbi:MAG TPA: hypothetical protein PKO15_00005 [Fibrobacteria bacterium]|nr:hypothetical protein [Fibrobacteria bacterium]HOX51117.1 hypothetical protein [Fibrobacteria bacterium]
MRFFLRMLFGIYPQSWFILAAVLLVLRLVGVPLVTALSIPVTLLICVGMCIAGYIGLQMNKPRYY